MAGISVQVIIWKRLYLKMANRQLNIIHKVVVRDFKVSTEQLHFHFSLSCIGEGNGNPLQCSCLENPRDRGAWWAAVYGVAQSRTPLKQLSSSVLLKMLLVFACAGSSLLLGLFSGCGAWASPCGGLTCRRAQPAGFSGCCMQAQKLWHTGSVAPQHVGSSWIRD